MNVQDILVSINSPLTTKSPKVSSSFWFDLKRSERRRDGNPPIFCRILPPRYRGRDQNPMENEEQQRSESGASTVEEVKPKGGGGGGGWGGWGISPFSILSDLQKVATVAAEEISRNAMEAAKIAAKGISDMQVAADSDMESTDEEGASEESNPGGYNEDSEKEKIRNSALDKLEKASEDSLFGQGLKVIDSSVETFASSAWNALGSAWKGGTDLVHKMEQSSEKLTHSMQHGGLPGKSGVLGSSIIESGKTFTVKGMEMLERVGKETMELLISETGFDVDKNPKDIEQQSDEQFEEITFERCFYIYGGPDHLEELEALSNHHALLFNRRKAKLASEQKTFYDGKLKQVQQIFSLGVMTDDTGMEQDKGKNIEGSEDDMNDLKILCNGSVSKAADMAAGFAAALGGLATAEIIQRTENRLEGIHSEGIHRLSEMCCYAVSHLVMIGKSVISKSNKSGGEDLEEDSIKIDWPEDSVLKGNIIRSKAKSMSGDVEAVSNGFVTGISDIIEAYAAAMKGASTEIDDTRPATIHEKAQAISELIRTSQKSALDKIQDALQYLAYVVLSTSMPSA